MEEVGLAVVGRVLRGIRNRGFTVLDVAYGLHVGYFGLQLSASLATYPARGAGLFPDFGVSIGAALLDALRRSHENSHIHCDLRSRDLYHPWWI